MSFIPKGVTRLAGRSLLKLNASSPTILVVAGVVGFGATVIVAAQATRKIDPVIDIHKKTRLQLDEMVYTNKRAQSKDVGRLYGETTYELAKIYAPAITLGVLSTGSILYGHKIIRGRHIATMAAYSGLMEQFQSYRDRVKKTLGEDVERGIFNGAHGEWVEQNGKKGEYKLEPVYNELELNYLRPWFDEVNCNYQPDAQSNYLFLKGVQGHMNDVLSIRGHVFLNDVFDALKIPRTKESSVMGWVYGPDGDNYIDFGFMTGTDPQSVAFRNFESPRVRLNFNVNNEPIWNRI
jgi:hypothetical protein